MVWRQALCAVPSRYTCSYVEAIHKRLSQLQPARAEGGAGVAGADTAGVCVALLVAGA